ncbi:MAG: hypothetical protein IKN15_01685 [Bacteroidaceae bacterium]|nr:hypothetical protein [Bacteroidaceae bacterium]
MQPLYEYVCHIKGNRNSKGELAEWVIKSHETGKILSSHKSEQKAKEHLQQMHIFNEAADGFTSDSKSDKLLGESTYGTDMDKRVKIFMEGVSQLGLSANQVDAIGKLTKVCMESETFDNTNDELPADYLNMSEYDPEEDDNANDNDNTEHDDAHELTMDEMYDKLIEQGVSQQTISIVTDIIGWNPDSMLKILDAATGYKSFDQLPEF